MAIIHVPQGFSPSVSQGSAADHTREARKAVIKPSRWSGFSRFKILGKFQAIFLTPRPGEIVSPHQQLLFS